MAKKLNKSNLHTILFIIGLVLAPFLVFSQQEEQPKRVTVTVSATPITAEKEIVQLPADNLPQTNTTKPRKAALTRHPNNKAATPPVTTAPNISTKHNNGNENSKIASASKKQDHQTIIKENNSIDKKPVQEKPKPVTTATVPKAAPIATPSGTSIATNKTKHAEETVPVRTSTDTAIKVSTPQTSTPIATIAQDNDKKEATRAITFSYIWIGIFLVIAGVVLGLLFGRPAFLVSFVGVVFIALGLMI